MTPDQGLRKKFTLSHWRNSGPGPKLIRNFCSLHFTQQPTSQLLVLLLSTVNQPHSQSASQSTTHSPTNHYPPWSVDRQPLSLRKMKTLRHVSSQAASRKPLSPTAAQAHGACATDRPRPPHCL